jgi:hypothetical protein
MSSPTVALALLPRRQATWVVGSAAAAVVAAFAGLWASQPTLALALVLATGAATVSARALTRAPLLVGAVVLAALGAERIEVPGILAAGAVVGLALPFVMSSAPDRWDLLHGTLGAVAAAGLGLWAAYRLLPGGFDGSGGALEAGLAGGLFGLLSAQGMVPLALRLDADPLPSEREIRAQLSEPYRPPALRASRLVRGLKPSSGDGESRRGLGEVARWILRLQVTLQALDAELREVDPGATERRIAELEARTEDDAFTRERRVATATHLRRMLSHTEAIRVERQRTEALVEYALAFLDEARVGLVIASELPGEAGPDRLDEVLGRLRTQAAGGEARRQTRRELGAIGA